MAEYFAERAVLPSVGSRGGIGSRAPSKRAGLGRGGPSRGNRREQQGDFKTMNLRAHFDHCLFFPYPFGASKKAN